MIAIIATRIPINHAIGVFTLSIFASTYDCIRVSDRLYLAFCMFFQTVFGRFDNQADLIKVGVGQRSEELAARPQQKSIERARYVFHEMFQCQSDVSPCYGRRVAETACAVRSSATQTGLNSLSDMEKKGKPRLSSGQSIQPAAFFLRCWEHEDLVLFLESVGEIEEFGFLGDEGGLPIGCLRELRLEICDLVLE